MKINAYYSKHWYLSISNNSSTFMAAIKCDSLWEMRALHVHNDHLKCYEAKKTISLPMQSTNHLSSQAPNLNTTTSFCLVHIFNL